MKIFDQTTEYINQGGKRRGANMDVLRVDPRLLKQSAHCDPGECRI